MAAFARRPESTRPPKSTVKKSLKENRVQIGHSCVRTLPHALWNALRIGLMLGLVAGPFFARAQSSSAAINGTITDTSGAVIPDAEVTLTNTETGTQQQTRS